MTAEKYGDGRDIIGQTIAGYLIAGYFMTAFVEFLFLNIVTSSCQNQLRQ